MSFQPYFLESGLHLPTIHSSLVGFDCLSVLHLKAWKIGAFGLIDSVLMELHDCVHVLFEAVTTKTFYDFL